MAEDNLTHPIPTVSAEKPHLASPNAATRRERLLVGLFCLLAGVRVFLFTAAFPFFSCVDEQYHFDLVCRYAHGDVPSGPEPFSAEAAELIALYGSPEYLQDLGDLPAAKVAPPVWASAAEVRARLFRQRTDIWKNRENHEAVQPPLYYALVAGWGQIGKWLAFDDGNFLYWLRFFNVPVYVVLVWLSYLLAKELCPASRFVYLGVPCLLVSFPQDIFYNLNNDVLSAPLVALSLYLLFRLYESDDPRPGLALAAGVAAAAAVLDKFTNAPVLTVVTIVAAAKLLPWWRKRRPPRHLLPVILLLLAAGLPVACWLARNYVVLGDMTGMTVKCRCLTWTPKPLSEYGNHPIFTLRGCLAFWNHLMTTFWRGDESWHGNRLAASALDTVYVVSSTVFLVTILIATVGGGVKTPLANRSAAVFCLLPVALSIAFLIFCSITVDFGQCFFPSRQWPFFRWDD